MLFGQLNTKDKELLIPRPDYEQSGYDLIPNNPLIKWADGSTTLADGNKDYITPITDPDKIFSNKLTKLEIKHRFNIDYGIPDANEVDELDLTPFIFLNIINLRSPFLNASNIKLPEIVTPLISIESADVLHGYAGENSLTGILDLRPLNVNGMFGGTTSLSPEKPDLDDTIIPTSCDRPIIGFRVISRSNSFTDTWDISNYSRLGGIINLAGQVKHDIIFPTFV